MPDPAATPPDPRLEELVAKCIERDERLGNPGIEEICRAHPDLKDAVVRRFEMLKQMGLLSDTQAPGPGGKATGDYPETLGDFKLLGRVGGGGMGIVFLARQVSLGREVALKLIRPEHLYFEGAKDRFRREVEAVASLSHPGIIPIYMVGEEKGIPYYAMEHVAGSSLGEILESLRGQDVTELTGVDFAAAIRGVDAIQAHSLGEHLGPTWSQACLRTMLAVAQALAHAHGRGVIHRDIKPSNVLIRPDGRPVLLDFGLAQHKGSSKLTQTGSALGSPHYMAPEVWSEGGTAADQRSDVYSLGVTLYELLALAPPFDGNADELFVKVLRGEFDPLRRRNESVPWDVETVCLKAMDLDPKNRYASAAELARDLQNVLELRPITAARPSMVLRVKRFTQRRPGSAMAVLLAFFIVVIFPVGYAAVLRVKNREIQKKNIEVERQRGVAEKQRAAAEAHRNATLGAIDTMITNLADQSLNDVSGIEDLRKRALEQAQAVVDQLSGSERELLDMKRRVLSIKASIAHLTAVLGDHALALEQSQRIIAEAKSAFGDEPQDRPVRYMLAYEMMYAGEMTIAIGRTADAEPIQRDSIERLEKLVAEDESDLQARWSLMRVLGSLSGTLHDLGRFDEAAATEARARKQLKDALERWPEDRELNRRWFESNSAAAVRALNLGDLAKAKELHDLVEKRMAERGLGDVTATSTRESAALIRSNLALVCAETGEYAKSVDWLDGAITDLRLLVTRFPSRPTYRALLARCLGQVAENRNFVQYSSDEAKAEAYRRSLAEFAEAVSIFHSMQRDEVVDQTILSDLCAALGSWGDWLQRGGSYDEAIEKYREAERILESRLEANPNGPTDRLNLAIDRTELSRALGMVDRLDEALAVSDAAWSLLVESDEKGLLPKSAFHEFGAANRLSRAGMLIDRHLPREAALAIEQLSAFEMPTQTHVDCLRKLVFCLEDAKNDPSIPDDERPALISRCARAAVVHLDALTAAGFDLEPIRSDERASYLLDTAEFKEWAAKNEF